MHSAATLDVVLGQLVDAHSLRLGSNMHEHARLHQLVENDQTSATQTPRGAHGEESGITGACAKEKAQGLHRIAVCGLRIARIAGHQSAIRNPQSAIPTPPPCLPTLALP